jgi:hypothetical protein
VDSYIQANTNDAKPQIPFGVEKARNDHLGVQKVDGESQGAYPKQQRKKYEIRRKEA